MRMRMLVVKYERVKFNLHLDFIFITRISTSARRNSIIIPNKHNLYTTENINESLPFKKVRVSSRFIIF